MTRRPVKMGVSRARTGWLLWLAWGIFGTIFLFEDAGGGSLVLSFLLTAPLWCLWAAWPLLWLWRVAVKNPATVTLDDDIEAAGIRARLVVKDGVQYVEKEAFSRAFHCAVPEGAQNQSLSGGDEVFVRLDVFRAAAKTNEALGAWIGEADRLWRSLDARTH